VEGGRGKTGKMVLVGAELFRLPRVWECLGIQLGDTENRPESGVIERAVDRRVDVFLRRGGCPGPWAGVTGGTG